MEENTSQHEVSTSIQRESHGHFAKGKSANPGGRAKMPPEIREMLEAKAQDAVNVYIKHLGDTDPRVSLKAAELILDRAYGKVQVASDGISIEVPENTGSAQDLKDLHARVVGAAASGAVSLPEARDMSAIIETHRKIIETTDLESRIARLESDSQRT